MLSNEKYEQSLFLFKSIDTTNQKSIRMIRLDALMHNTGVCYLHLGNYMNAEKYLVNAIKKITARKDSVGLIGSYTDLGTVYYEQYQDDKAINYYEKAYSLSKKFGSYDLKVLTSQNMAVIEENLSLIHI